MKSDSLLQLADALGITRGYQALDGRQIPTGIEVARRFVEGMGIPATEASFEQVMKDRWRAGLEPAAVARPGVPGSVAWTLPHAETDAVFEWCLTFEGGEKKTGTIRGVDCPILEAGQFDDRRAFPLPSLPAGYHSVSIMDSECHIICAPEKAFRPKVLAERGAWGPTVQLYAIRSERNWGVGDFDDLVELVRFFAGLGADFVGLNPLHSLFPDNPAHCSPYSPSSRTWLNPVYIAVDSVPEVKSSAAAQRAIAEIDFKSLRDPEFVDYPRVVDQKMKILKLAFDELIERKDERYEEFQQWVAEMGEPLELFTTWEALQIHYSQEGRIGFFQWPKHAQSPEIAGELPPPLFVLREFRQYLQWCAAEQLAAAADVAAEVGMQVGLYTDLAVGVEGTSAERWIKPELYGDGASVGAPPDSFNLKGQDWGMPPPIPHAMRTEGHASFRQVLSAAMKTSGAVRIDHVMALRRLYWVPHGLGAAEGAYVLYPFDEMMAVVTLESIRNRCLVVGEDLGVVPPEVTEALQRSGSFSYRILFFEQSAPDRYLRPHELLANSLTVGSTHDLPTLRGFWEERDLEVRDELDLWPNESVRSQFVRDRAQQRRALIDALVDEGLLEQGTQAGAMKQLPQSVADALLLYVARGANELMAIQLEDVMGQLDQVNLPGTVDEHPNWRRKLPQTIEALFSSSDRVALFRQISEERLAHKRRP